MRFAPLISPLTTSLKKLVPVLLASPLLLLSGCFQVEEVVHLKTDGSGTIEETCTMSSAAIAQIKQMQAGAAGANAKPVELFDEAKLKEQASKMGDGVTFVSAKKLKTPTGEGFAATFAFTDINKLKISPEPPSMGDGGTVTTDDSKAITFKFDKGHPAQLSINNPQSPKEDAAAAPKAPDAAADATSDAMGAMLMQALKDMRVTVRVETEGTIVNTNSAYKDGSKVTLFDVDFNKVLADPAKAKQLMKSQDQTAESAKLLKTIPGIAFETANPVIIKFQ